MKIETLPATASYPKTKAWGSRMTCAVRILPMLLGLALPAAVQAQFTYFTNSEGTITITGYTCSGNPVGEVTIPSTIHGLPVTSLEYWACSDCDSLTNITIPDSVTSIGGLGSFRFCSRLTTITVDPRNSAYSCVDGVLLNKSQSTLIRCPEGKAGNFIVPASVNHIWPSAFESCTNLTGLFFQGGAPLISPHSFLGVYNLWGYYVPGTAGWDTTFDGLPMGLWDPQVPCSYTTNEGTISIKEYIGSGGSVVLPATMQGLPLTRIGENAFADSANLTSVTIPDSVQFIEGGAFAGCERLASIAIPDSVLGIGSYAFWGCYSLTNLTLGNRLEGIGIEAFYGCASLINVTIPDRVTAIGPSAFDNCSNLTHFAIGRSLIYLIGTKFEGCGRLTTITVDAANTVYSSVDGVLLNKSQTAVLRCPAGRAGSFTLPNSVTSIAGEAFSGCLSLTAVYFQGNAPSVGAGEFNGANQAMVFYLPGTTGWQATFGGRPTSFWLLPNPAILAFPPAFGVLSNGFGFTISWATNTPVLIEACANLDNPIWAPVQTNTLTDGWSYFSDAEWTNYAGRYYRVRTP